VDLGQNLGNGVDWMMNGVELKALNNKIPEVGVKEEDPNTSASHS
jgi:hypothetical protein